MVIAFTYTRILQSDTVEVDNSYFGFPCVATSSGSDDGRLFAHEYRLHNQLQT